ncbi:hypothetical protein Tco_1257533 [Tanacetum coccineum]
MTCIHHEAYGAKGCPASIYQALAAANTHVKAQRRELDELRSVIRSDPRMVELLSQLGSGASRPRSSSSGAGRGVVPGWRI